MAAMAQMSRGALSARPFAPSVAPKSVRPTLLKAAGSEQLWLPGIERPNHLNGDLPGDRGFDPLVSCRPRASATGSNGMGPLEGCSAQVDTLTV